MSATGGLVAGFLGLTALEAVLSTQGSAGRVSGLLGTAATVFEHLADPTIPAIPNLAAKTTTGATSSPSSAPLVPPSVNPAVTPTPGNTSPLLTA